MPRASRDRASLRRALGRARGEPALRRLGGGGPGLRAIDVRPVLIDHDGRWFAAGTGPEPQPGGRSRLPGSACRPTRAGCAGSATPRGALRPDIYFPVLHGPFGEDGTIQGLLELAGVPLRRARASRPPRPGMDKELMKALFASAGHPQDRVRAVRDLPAAR